MTKIVEFATTTEGANSAWMEADHVSYETLESRKTAYAIALTCKNFVPAALEQLWRTVDGVVPLLKLLPCHVWKRNKRRAIDGARQAILHVRLAQKRFYWSLD